MENARENDVLMNESTIYEKGRGIFNRVIWNLSSASVLYDDKIGVLLQYQQDIYVVNSIRADTSASVQDKKAICVEGYLLEDFRKAKIYHTAISQRQVLFYVASEEEADKWTNLLSVADAKKQDKGRTTDTTIAAREELASISPTAVRLTVEKSDAETEEEEQKSVEMTDLTEEVVAETKISDEGKTRLDDLASRLECLNKVQETETPTTESMGPPSRENLEDRLRSLKGTPAKTPEYGDLRERLKGLRDPDIPLAPHEDSELVSNLNTGTVTPTAYDTSEEAQIQRIINQATDELRFGIEEDVEIDDADFMSSEESDASSSETDSDEDEDDDFKRASDKKKTS